jgi:hypothetical protein
VEFVEIVVMVYKREDGEAVSTIEREHFQAMRLIVQYFQWLLEVDELKQVVEEMIIIMMKVTQVKNMEKLRKSVRG